jgi:DNA (cytosine-5)-methyltransferase 1
LPGTNFKVSTPRKPYDAIDLFSGCGGLSYGLANSGIHAKSAVDNWPEALATYEANHLGSSIIDFDLGAKNLNPLKQQLNDAQVVFGGPPCQGFSISGKRDPDDPRNLLYRGFFEVVADVRPKVFLMENVPNLASMDGGRLIEAIEEDFVSLGYSLTRRILLASDYGVPQNRKRLFLFGTLSDVPYEFPVGKTVEKLDKVTSGMAISDLPEHAVSEGSRYTSKPTSKYQVLMRKNSQGVFNHQTTNHSEQTRRIISLVPDGGNYKSLPPELQQTRRVNIAWTRFASDKPSPTIDTGHRHHFHYSFDRVPTVRESARLQSFPDSFIFDGTKTSQYKQVGNAVPPLLAEELGKSITNYLDKVRGAK